MTAPLTVAPPTEKQLESFRQHLKRALHIEHAAVLAGIPTKSLTKWLQLGRSGHKDFVEFVDIVDKVSATHASALIDMVTQAVSDGDVKAAQWLYKQRYDQREKKLTEKWLELEEMIEGSGESAPADEDVAAAEARLLGEELH